MGDCLELSEREPDAVITTKVKAHPDVKSISDPRLHWMAYMNNNADLLAKRCIRKHWGLELDAIVDRLKAREDDIAFLEDFHSMWREIQRRSTRKDQERKREKRCCCTCLQIGFRPEPG